MITKEQLQAMSDFEVNKVLAGMIYGYPEDKDIAKRINSGAIDFCNTPNDIMPLQIKYKVSLDYRFILDDWLAQCGLMAIHDLNPLRAIACCLILVLDGEIG